MEREKKVKEKMHRRFYGKWGHVDSICHLASQQQQQQCTMAAGLFYLFSILGRWEEDEIILFRIIIFCLARILLVV